MELYIRTYTYILYKIYWKGFIAGVGLNLIKWKIILLNYLFLESLHIILHISLTGEKI
jgi:hypothetical protein